MMVLGGLFLVVALGLFLRGQVALRWNTLKLERHDHIPRAAILVPARYESAVVTGLFESLANQTVIINPADVYVIVEDAQDPTVKIAEYYHHQVFVRQDLTRQCKGAALDEAIKWILPDHDYDAYFIFDADNVLAPDYFEKMYTSYLAGYEITTGYRNLKNTKMNVIAAVSGLTFSMINTMSNRERSEHGANIVISGTGYYIDGRLVEEWQGWPFQSLTEDYELSLYATLHGISTHYNEHAMFYDEQPTKYRQTVMQRVRWIKGYFTARKKYIPLLKLKKQAHNYGSIVKEKIGVRPAIYAIVGLVLLLVGAVVDLVVLGYDGCVPWVILGVLMLVYIVLMVITVVMLKRERYDLSPRVRFWTVVFNPLYLVTYIPCALKALLGKNVTWQRIDHSDQHN